MEVRDQVGCQRSAKGPEAEVDLGAQVARFRSGAVQTTGQNNASADKEPADLEVQDHTRVKRGHVEIKIVGRDHDLRADHHQLAGVEIYMKSEGHQRTGKRASPGQVRQEPEAQGELHLSFPALGPDSARQESQREQPSQQLFYGTSLSLKSLPRDYDEAVFLPYDPLIPSLRLGQAGKVGTRPAGLDFGLSYAGKSLGQ
jgi:hypothetical protein